jgi:hypothetical protein
VTVKTPGKAALAEDFDSPRGESRVLPASDFRLASVAPPAPRDRMGGAGGLQFAGVLSAYVAEAARGCFPEPKTSTTSTTTIKESK